MHLKTLIRASLLSLSLAALLGGTVAASDETTVKIVTDGQAEVIVLRDLDQILPIGETREFTADSGKLVIIGRSEEGLLIDIDGDLTDITLLPASATLADAETQDINVWVQGEAGDAGVVHIDRHVAVVHSGDAEISGHGEDGKRIIMIKSHAKHVDHEAGDSEAVITDGKRIEVITSAGDAGEIAAALAEAGVDAATQERILVKIEGDDESGSSKQVFVTRRMIQ